MLPLGLARKRRHHDPALPFEMQLLLLALQYLSTFDAVLLYARKTFTPGDYQLSNFRVRLSIFVCTTEQLYY